MKFRALNFCIMIILFNLSLTILTGANIMIGSDDSLGVEPHYPGEENTTSGSGRFHFGGFLDSSGHLSKAAITAVVIGVFGFLATTVVTGFLTPVGLNILVFSAVFWTTTTTGMVTINDILITLGWSYMILPLYLIFAIFFIIGAMELAGGGFGAHE